MSSSCSDRRSIFLTKARTSPRNADLHRQPLSGREPSGRARQSVALLAHALFAFRAGDPDHSHPPRRCAPKAPRQRSRSFQDAAQLSISSSRIHRNGETLVNFHICSPLASPLPVTTWGCAGARSAPICSHERQAARPRRSLMIHLYTNRTSDFGPDCASEHSPSRPEQCQSQVSELQGPGLNIEAVGVPADARASPPACNR